MTSNAYKRAEMPAGATARTLQWIADPIPVIRKMISMLYFYDAFLRWRADAGMDNAIGDTVATHFKAEGLTILATLDAPAPSPITMPGHHAKQSR